MIMENGWKKLLCFLHLDEFALKFQVSIEQYIEITQIIFVFPTNLRKRWRFSSGT